MSKVFNKSHAYTGWILKPYKHGWNGIFISTLPVCDSFSPGNFAVERLFDYFFVPPSLLQVTNACFFHSLTLIFSQSRAAKKSYQQKFKQLVNELESGHLIRN